MLDQALRLKVAARQSTEAEAGAALRQWANGLATHMLRPGIDPQIVSFHRAQTEAYIRTVEQRVSATKTWPPGRPGPEYAARANALLQQVRQQYETDLSRGVAPLSAVFLTQTVSAWTQGKAQVDPAQDFFAGEDERVEGAILAALPQSPSPGKVAGPPPPATPPAAPMPGVVVGAPMDGVDLQGTNLTYFRLDAPDYRLCDQACERNPNCGGYSYVKPGGYKDGDPPMCYLKSTVTGTVRNPRTVSAIVQRRMPAVGAGGRGVGGGATPTPSGAITPASVQLCEEFNYGGRCESFTNDNPDLRNSYVGNDTASSIRVPAGRVASVYEHVNYDGRCETIRRDNPDLRNSLIGNDVISSIRVGVPCPSGTGASPPAGTAPTSGSTVNVAGTWYGRGGAWVYQFTQSGNTFHWERNPRESADGTINGLALSASWGAGRGNGRVTQVDANNVATRIQWDNREVFVRSAEKGGAPPVASNADFRNLLLTWNWQWQDLGQGCCGAISFTSDGVAHPTWTGESQRWYVATNGDLIVTEGGTHYVVRFRFRPDLNLFEGARDQTSQVQDGIHTQLKPSSRK